MPKSKKTRAKKYHPKTVKVGPYWPAEAQADVEAKLTQIESPGRNLDGSADGLDRRHTQLVSRSALQTL